MSRLTGITYPDGSTVGFTYDSRGRRITATDQNNKTTTYTYDTADRLTEVTDPATTTRSTPTTRKTTCSPSPTPTTTSQVRLQRPRMGHPDHVPLDAD